MSFFFRMDMMDKRGLSYLLVIVLFVIAAAGVYLIVINLLDAGVDTDETVEPEIVDVLNTSFVIRNVELDEVAKNIKFDL